LRYRGVILQRQLKMKHASILILTLAAAAASAQEQAISLTIAAGKVGEVCMPLQAGDTLAWRFESSAAADFNLHDHVGAKVNLPVQRRAVKREQRQHKVERSNEWCLMWTAPLAQGITVTGSWRVRKGAAR
jgi:hypothetical protein